MELRATPGPTNLLGLPREGMREFFASLGEKPFRAAQVLKWIHHRHTASFGAMTDLGKALRARLDTVAEVRAPEAVADRVSADGTRKWLFRVDSGNCVETVYIPDGHRGTLCVSSQVGCALNCTFCATARQGFNRNLDAAEIVGQLWAASRILADSGHPGPDVTNVVLMGMGEPLLNLDNVVPALDLMLDDLGFGLARKRVTLSTAGVVPGIRALARRCPVSLAVSLHAPDDALRDVLVPINRKYPIDALLAACREFAHALPRQKVTFEYVMLDEVNDTPEHARRLARRLGRPPGEGQPHPVQPLPRHAVPALARRGDRPLPGRAPGGRGDDHHPQDPRRRHRRRLRAARREGHAPEPAGCGAARGARRTGATRSLKRWRRGWTPSWSSPPGNTVRVRTFARPGKRRT